MESIGFVKDKFGKSYEIKFWSNKNKDRAHYDMAAYDGSKEIGEFEFDVYDGEEYAHVDLVNVSSEYRSKGIYTAVLLLVKDFFKKKGLKGLFSEGKLRNDQSNKAWDKIENKKIIPVEFENRSYTNYALEHLKTFAMFEADSEYTVYDNKHGAKFWGDQGAGVLIICKKTGRILVAMRGEQVNEPNTWGIFGGKMDSGETPEQAAQRELTEESGYEGKYELFPAYVFIAPGNKFKYHNFIGIVEDEFKPQYDWETQYAEWMDLETLINIEPKHFGLKKLLDKSMDIIKKFAK